MAYSYQRATSDGTMTFIDISIDYLDRSEITVYFNDVLTSAWVWSGVTENRIIFTPGPVPNGVVVMVKRITDASKLRHKFSEGAAFTATTLDEDLEQSLHISQEASEANLVGDFFTDINMHGFRVFNVGTAISDADALTLGQYKADANGAYASMLAAQAAAAAATSVVAGAVQKTDLADTSSALKGAGLGGFNYALNYAVGTIGWALERGEIYAAWFGVKADKVTDDTVALQNAINFAGLLTRGAVVVLPFGSCLTTATINVNHSFVRIRGQWRYGINNSPEVMGSGIYCTTSGLDSVIKVQSATPGAGIYGVSLEHLAVSAIAGLGAPPIGIHLKDASEITISDCVAGSGLAVGLQLNGVDIIDIDRFYTSGTGLVGIKTTINGTSLFLSNDIIQIRRVNIFAQSVAGLLIDGHTNDLHINGYMEFVPIGVSLTARAGTNCAVDGLHLDGLHVWNGPSSPYINVGRFLKFLAPTGATNYLRLTGLKIDGSCRSYQVGANRHVEFLQNTNSNGTTAALFTGIEGGQWYSASSALMHSDLTSCTGDIRGNVICQAGYMTGATVPLRSGAGTNGWGTEESGTWTPTDQSGGSLTFSNAAGTYSRKGTLVTASFRVTFPATADTNGAKIGGLPFATKATPTNFQGGSVNYTNRGISISFLLESGLQTGQFWDTSGAVQTNVLMTAKDARVTVTYESV